MPATRTARRVSSVVLPPSPSPPSPNNDTRPSSAQSATRPTTPLFPCSQTPPVRRPSHHKKRPASHIPRPPNAFILFRANFIRDRHLQTTTEGPLSNVSPTALSTIVGITWRNLPEEERQIWVEKARIAREEHKILHPTYRYQPLPTAEERAASRENKRRIKEENIMKPDLERCNLISTLLVQGHRGQELEDMVAEFDRTRPIQPSPPRSAANGVVSQITRSSSLPTPPRRRPAKRPRASSTSSWTGESIVSPSVPRLHGGVFPHASQYTMSPEPHSAVAYSEAGLHSYVEPAMPDLTYDPASPSSVNLPELHEGGYPPQSHRVDGSTYQHHSLPSFSSQDSSHSLHRTSPMVVPTTDPFGSYSSFSTWDASQQVAEPYHQFSYFAPMNETIMTTETQLSHTVASTHVDPYASSIPPFQLYHALKPFEQSFHGFSTTPDRIHVIDHEYTYDDS